MRYWLCISSLFMLLVMSGCQKKANISSAERAQSQELRLNIHTEPPTLDPRRATDTTSGSIIKMCFEGLMSLDPAGNPIPGIAERAEVSEDSKTYTFYLRDALWTDGQPVTAYDFEYTWKTLLSPTFPCEFAIDLYILKNAEAAKLGRCSVEDVGVKAIDEKTLIVHLDHPVPYFLTLAASHSFPATPKHITEHYPNWADECGPHYVGNGPFYLSEWRHQNQIEVKKNPTYWDSGQVKLEKLTLSIIEDENTELSMFESGELDWTGSPLSQLPLDAIVSLKQKEDIQIYPISGTYYYIFNTKQIPFNNVHIRRAFALAINRQAIIDNITQTLQLPAMALIPPTMWKREAGYFADDDLAKAQKELQIGLDELGMTIDQLPPLTLSYNTLSSHHKVAQAIQGQWFDAFGIRIKLENKEWKVFLDELRHQQFQIARMGGVASFKDPVTFLELYKYLSSSNNYCQWTNARFTELLEKADVTADENKRMALLKEAEKIFIDDMPIAPIYFYTGSYLKKPYVKGVILSDLSDVDFKHAYLEFQ